MKRFTAFLFTLLLCSSAFASSTFPNLVWPTAEYTHSAGSQLHLNSDIIQSFGGTPAAPLVWFVHDLTNTQFELNSTNVDGAGADGVPLYLGDGTDDSFFSGNINLDGGDIVLDKDDGNTKILHPGSDRMAFQVGGLSINIYEDADDRADFPGYRLLDSLGPLNIGADATTGHSLATGSVIIGADAGSIALEVDGVTYFDATTWWTDGTNNFGSIQSKADDGLHLTLNPSNNTSNNHFILTANANGAKDHDHDTPSTNPTWIVHSVTNPDTRNYEWISMAHNQTDGEFGVGTGGGDYKFIDDGGKGAASYIRTKTESVTFTNDATQVTAGSIIPAGAFTVGISGRVTTANTGACGTMDVGIAGKDTDAFGDGIAVTLSTTFTHANGNAAAIWGANTTDATALDLIPSMVAQEITVTGVGGNCDALVVALTVHYIDVSAATSN
jgi:hypothetical protein